MQPESILWVAITSVVVWIAGHIAARYHLPFWSWMRWHITCWKFQQHRKRNFKPTIVTMADYVFLLEQLRDAIIGHYKHNEKIKPKIIVHVFTMQLPSDWPLWDTARKAEDGGKTPLEDYYFNFHSFVKDGKIGSRYSVDLKRAIVIDSLSSPRGKTRFDQLKKDVNSSYFQNYIDMLHTSNADARFHTTERPWPGWMTDAVFYGVEVGNVKEWLWAVTTSFNTGEDLILLRHHRLTKSWKHEQLPLPADLKTLIDLAEEAGGRTWIVPELSTLKATPTTAEEQASVTHAVANRPSPTEGKPKKK